MTAQESHRLSAQSETMYPSAIGLQRGVGCVHRPLSHAKNYALPFWEGVFCVKHGPMIGGPETQVNFLGIDVGTGGTRAAVVEDGGRVVGAATSDPKDFAFP